MVELPKEIVWRVHINNIDHTVILSNRHNWIKGVPELDLVPEEGVHIYLSGSDTTKTSHKDFYVNGEKRGSAPAMSGIGGSLYLSPAGTSVVFTSGEEFQFLPMDPDMSQLTYFQSSGWWHLSSPTSGWVATLRFYG